MTLIGQHARSGDYVPENSGLDVKNGNVDIQFLRAPCFLFFQNQKKKCTFWFMWHHLILSTFPFFRPSLKFSETLSPLLACCPISVIHIWKAYDVYFLNFIVSRALFSKKNITFRWFFSNKWFLTIFCGQCLISRQCIFLGYLNPHHASKWLILKLMSMPWQ